MKTLKITLLAIATFAISTLSAQTPAAKVDAEALAQATGLPLIATTVAEHLYPDLEGKVSRLFPLKLQNNKPF